jgi:hypothetical protein
MRKFPSLGEYDGNFVHRRIAVGGCMRSRYIPRLVKVGIRAIVNVTGVAQKSHLIYIADLPVSIHWQLLGYWDGSAALAGQEPGKEHLAPDFAGLVVDMTMRIIRDRSPVLIHCGGGIGRSGNLAAIAVAALENITPQEAIEQMRVYRPKLADFSKNLWKHCDVPGLVKRAREILAQPVGKTSIDMMP